MLQHLAIKNLTTVEQVELEFHDRLTTITGETGAGKSVMLDAIALAIGTRNAKHSLRNETQSAEVSASFNVTADSPAAQWLSAQELSNRSESNDNLNDQEDIILRRVIKPDGRSRAFINGRPVNLSDLKRLGEQLIDLHSQHEYQSLLSRQTQQQLLDDYAAHPQLITAVHNRVSSWQTVEQKVQTLKNHTGHGEARQQLLAYQVQELDKLALNKGETQQLEAEQKLLAHSENLLALLDNANQLLNSDEGSSALNTTRQALALTKQTLEQLPALQSSVELLDSASIQIEEALSDIQNQTAQIKIDPERLQFVEDRLDKIYTIARKHQVNPDQLFEQHNSLSHELSEIENSDEALLELEKQKIEIIQKFHVAAKKLTSSRKKAAAKLMESIASKLAELKMKHCEFEIALKKIDAEQPSTSGHESVEFLISTVPGKPTKPLAQIASGGELSRISLAIQVSTAQTSNTPTLVFDEVDVGIGGGVAEVVGKLLRELSNNCQIFCVTHLAQVAAKGNQQLLVDKKISQSSVTTRFELLNTEARKSELARMISGIDVTASTLAHASEMLESA